MSLLILAAAAALPVSSQPVHSVDIDHRGSTYQVDYRPHIETRMRTIGMAAGTRPSTRRCIVSAEVNVERVVTASRSQGAGTGLRSMLPNSERFTQQMPGSCHGRDDAAAQLVQGRSAAIAAHLAQTAAQDRPRALAAIDSAQHFAAN